jgi:hypothetical protein
MDPTKKGEQELIGSSSNVLNPLLRLLGTVAAARALRAAYNSIKDFLVEVGKKLNPGHNGILRQFSNTGGYGCRWRLFHPHSFLGVEQWMNGLINQFISELVEQHMGILIDQSDEVGNVCHRQP